MPTQLCVGFFVVKKFVQNRSISQGNLIKYIVFEYFDVKYKKLLKPYFNTYINEIRLRVNKSPKLITNNEVIYLNNVIVSQEDLENIVKKACNGSIYAYDEQLKRGFITTIHGERIGISGEFVLKNGEVVAIKNFTSLNVRIPNEVKNCSLNFYKQVYKGGSVLIISKTGVGKTTFLRDFTYQLSSSCDFDIVVIDERNEIAGYNYCNFSFDLNKNVDVLTFCDKNYGFNQAIRTLNPKVIITDELMNSTDSNGVLRAIKCGISVICSVHLGAFEEIFNLSYLNKIVGNKLFDYYVFLDVISGMRKEFYYDKNFNLI